MSDKFKDAKGVRNAPISPLPPRSPVPPGSPKTPLCKTKSAGPERVKPPVTVERFLSVEQGPKLTRRKSGSGLQDLSASSPSSPQPDHHKGKGKALLTNLLLPLNTYVRRRSTSSRDSDSTDLESDDSRSKSGSGGSNKNLTADVGLKRRGSYNAFFAMLGKHSKEGKSQSGSRRNSIDLIKERKNSKSKDQKEGTPPLRKSSSGVRKNSLDVLKDKKAADAMKEMKSKKPDVSKKWIGEKSPKPPRKDSIEVARDRKFSETEEHVKKDKSKMKEKVSKKRSLGETLSLKIPVSAIRRNSIDAFSLKNLFSLSRKNSVEDIRDKDDKKSHLDSLLKPENLDLSKRRHSTGGGDPLGAEGASYVYKPLQRQRLRLGSQGLAGLSRSGSGSASPSLGAPSIVINDSHGSRKKHKARSGRRSSGPSVVVSPPSGSSSSSVHSSVTGDDSYSSGSMSHSSITSLESNELHSSDETDSDYDDKGKPPRAPQSHHKRKKPHPRPKSRHHSGSSRASSTTEDDVFDTSEESSEEERGSSKPRRGGKREEEKGGGGGGGNFWASLQATPPPVDVAASSEEDIYNLYDDYIFNRHRGRRNSGDLQDRSRHSSGSLTSVYIRGMDPTTAANVFRDCRGLPEADPLIQYLSKEEESQILVKFFKLHHSYDLIPTSAKLVIFDTSLQVKKAFYALVRNGVRAAPLWDHDRQKFVGMLTITDFIRILHSFHHTHDPQMEKLEDHRLYEWRTFLQDEDRPLISISPDESLYDAIRFLIHHKIHRLPVIDPATGNVLYIITHKRILKFLYLYIKEIPKPAVLQKTIGELDIGSYENIETATADMLIIEALDKFVKHRISALPIVDAEGKLQDIYAKFDVINLAAEGTYHKLDVTLRQANEYRNEWFEGVLRCRRDEKLITVMDRIVHAEVHRLVVVDNEEKVIGIVSLSDILKVLVLQPCDDESPTSAATAAALNSLSLASPSQADAPLTKSGSEESCGDPDNLTEGLVSPEGGKGSSGDSEDEGRYSMDKSEETPPAVTTPEVIPISG